MTIIPVRARNLITASKAGILPSCKSPILDPFSPILPALHRLGGVSVCGIETRLWSMEDVAKLIE
jgi:hypothetical protein